MNSGEISTTKENVTILVADDEDNNYSLITIILQGMNFNILRAYDGDEAVDICKANPNIRLILMDIKMPKLNGNMAAGLIKEFRPDLPIIAQTAFGKPDEKDKIVFDDYITKPLRRELLVNKVLKFINKV